MNKLRRHELKMLHYKRRLRNYRIKVRTDISQNLYAFRSHGKPCSCYACQQYEQNYNRAKVKSEYLKEINS